MGRTHNDAFPLGYGHFMNERVLGRSGSIVLSHDAAPITVRPVVCSANSVYALGHRDMLFTCACTAFNNHTFAFRVTQ